MLKFEKAKKDQKIRELQYYYAKNFDEDIGLIKAEQIFDFFVSLIGDEIYNQGLDDASDFLKKQLGEVQFEYYNLYRGDEY